MKALSDDRALVLLSGGQDSTTCLAWALDRFAAVETVGFDYGQRHRVEIACRETIRALMGAPDGSNAARLGPDHLFGIPTIAAMGATAMTSDMTIGMTEAGLPSTFVPGRNLIFMAFAAALAYRRDCRHVVLGVCETDFSGYPDCRDDTVKAMQVALNLGLETRLVLHTPLMWIDKAGTFAMAERLGGDDLLRLVIEETHTCYLGDRTHRHAWGYGCGTCPACELRADGWRRWRSDPGSI